jgi:hypothetical protein
MRARPNEVRLLLLGCPLKPVTPFIEFEADPFQRGRGEVFKRFDVRRGLGRTPESSLMRALPPSRRSVSD